MEEIIYPYKKYNYRVLIDQNEEAIESLELVCEGITRIK